MQIAQRRIVFERKADGIEYGYLIVVLTSANAPLSAR